MNRLVEAIRGQFGDQKAWIITMRWIAMQALHGVPR
jgi:hypothetical protein